MRSSGGRVRILAPAKINLALRVGAADPATGYHEVDTTLLAVDLCDELEVVREREAEGPPRLEVVEGEEPCPPEENLASRAASAFLERLGVQDTLRIRLAKRIPSGAGLGGGSSDAGAVLRALALLYPGGLSGPRLLEIARALGADVPFFVAGDACAHGTGRGDRLRPLEAPPRRPVVLALPSGRIATGRAYRALDDRRQVAGGSAEPPGSAPERAPVSPLASATWGALARSAANDFEEVIARELPATRELVLLLRREGAGPALLSGSGAATFGVFRDPASARRAVAAIRASGLAEWVVEAHTLRRFPAPEVVSE